MTDAPTTPDPVEMAMAAEAHDRSPDSPARTLLVNQNRLVLWQIAGERAGFALKVLTALAGVAVAAGVALMARQASRANGLVVEAFLVPPALAAQGATGEVVARDVLDRLGRIDAEARSLETVQVSDAWTQSSRIQVAETGLSPDDIQRLLRRWLGHETYVSGEVVQTAAGVRLKVRSGVGRAITAEGPSDQLPALAEQAAEGLFAQARPRSYVEVLLRRRDLAGAKALVARLLATSKDPRDRAAAWYFQGVLANIEQRGAEALGPFREATKSPDRVRAAMAQGMTAWVEETLGHPRQAEAAAAEALRLIEGSNAPARAVRVANYRANLFNYRNDFTAAEQTLRPVVGQDMPGAPPGAFQGSYAAYLVKLHRASEARNASPALLALIAARSGDWTTAARLSDAAAVEERLSPFAQSRRLIMLARAGRLEEAREIAATLPADCAGCLSARAVLASVSGDRAGADALFAAAARLEPRGSDDTITWGRERLAWGRPDAAIEVFRSAARASPRWADPLHWWGETLLLKGDARGAAAKFAQAERFAPKWGRLHLKWGMALARLGKTEEARAHWRLAATLDLSAAERAELQRVTR